jgi:hypothetical protein
MEIKPYEGMKESDRDTIVDWIRSCKNLYQLNNVVWFFSKRFGFRGELSTKVLTEIQKKTKELNHFWAIDRIHGKV